jgi:hypothetical protein
MPRLKHPNEKTRLHLDIAKPTRERIERLQQVTEADSLTEVVRRSVTTYEALYLESKELRGRIVIRYPDGSEKELILV